MASALRRCAVLLRLVAHPRRSARRRSAQTTTGRRMARAVHCHRSVREPGRRPSPTPSTALERLGLNAVDIRTCAACEGGPTVAAKRYGIRHSGDPRIGRGDRSATRRTATCPCKSPRIGPRASTSATPATSSKQGRPPIPPHGRKGAGSLPAGPASSAKTVPSATAASSRGATIPRVRTGAGAPPARAPGVVALARGPGRRKAPLTRGFPSGREMPGERSKALPFDVTPSGLR